MITAQTLELVRGLGQQCERGYRPCVTSGGLLTHPVLDHSARWKCLKIRPTACLDLDHTSAKSTADTSRRATGGMAARYARLAAKDRWIHEKLFHPTPCVLLPGRFARVLRAKAFLEINSSPNQSKAVRLCFMQYGLVWDFVCTIALMEPEITDPPSMQYATQGRSGNVSFEYTSIIWV